MPSETTKLPESTRANTTGVSDSTPEINEELHAWLLGYVETPGITRHIVGIRLGYRDGSTVSRYINKVAAGDIPKFEDRLRDLKQRTETLRDSTPDGTVWETSVYRQTHHFCDIVSQSRDVGVLYGPAGVGKSTVLRSYAQQHHTALYTETNASQAGAKGMANILWNTLTDKNGYGPSQSRWNYLVDKFKNSERLIIVDNAQRLNKEGRDFIFDFHDESGCPIVLAGNPSILSSVAKNDQQHSRCLLQHEVGLKNEELAELAQQFTERHLPNCPEIWPYARQVAEREGYLRALDKVLKTAAVFTELEGLSDPVQAFKAAHAKSTRNYKLID